MVFANVWSICGNRHHLQVVCIDQFGCFCLRRTGHTCQLVVHAEVVLQCDGGECLILFVDANAFFGLHRLVKPFTPATAFQNATCELVDNLYFATINDVILVALVQLFCA